MNIKIKKLTPELADDYIHFFDTTKHDDGIDEHKCYCVCWCSDDHRTGKDFSTAEKRRAMAGQYVKDGAIQGYLAYNGGKVVGWCNANTKSDCLNCISWLMFMKNVPTGESEPNVKVKSVFCFAIAPEYQRKGIASKLLKRVVQDAAEEGFDFVEAYPKKTFVSTEDDFHGPVGMYKKAGFEVVTEVRDMVVVRKAMS